MRDKLARLCVLILACTALARAAEPGSGENVLQKTGMFALGGIGVAGTMSEGERALRELLRGSDPLVRLDRLLSTASPAGQLYALLGLRLKDRGAYDRAVARMRATDAIVHTARGCMLSRESFGDLLKEIERGQYDDFLAREWPPNAR
jgi:hypothetical protein